MENEGGAEKAVTARFTAATAVCFPWMALILVSLQRTRSKMGRLKLNWPQETDYRFVDNGPVAVAILQRFL